MSSMSSKTFEHLKMSIDMTVQVLVSDLLLEKISSNSFPCR